MRVYSEKRQQCTFFCVISDLCDWTSILWQGPQISWLAMNQDKITFMGWGGGVGGPHPDRQTNMGLIIWLRSAHHIVILSRFISNIAQYYSYRIVSCSTYVQCTFTHTSTNNFFATAIFHYSWKPPKIRWFSRVIFGHAPFQVRLCSGYWLFQGSNAFFIQL